MIEEAKILIFMMELIRRYECQNIESFNIGVLNNKGTTEILIIIRVNGIRNQC